MKTKTIFTGTADERTVFDGFRRDGAGNLVSTTATITTVGGFKLLFAGELVIGNRLTISGEVLFRLELAGADPGIELVVNGTLELDPIGGVYVVDSGFRINAQGLVARVEAKLAADFGDDIGLDFSVGAVLALNTTGRSQTLGSTVVEAGFLLRINGSINFGFASGSGFVEVRLNPNGFQLLFGVAFDLGGLQFRLDGGAAVVGGADPGFALRVAVSVSADAPVFSISASGTLELNTTQNTTLVGVAANSFLLDLNGSVSILKVLNFEAGLRIVVANGGWSFNAFVTLDFFGLASLSGTVALNSRGDFSINISGFLQLGSSSFGLRGDFSFSITSCVRGGALEIAPCSTTPGADGTYVLQLSGSASVKVRAFGITLAGVGLSFRFAVDTATAGPDGRVKIELTVKVTITILGIDITKTARFTIGYLQFPPPTYLAGNNSGTLRDWGDSDTRPVRQRR